jgi:hypothetical protein
MSRVVVIGDVGGHPDQLRWALAQVGAVLAPGGPPVLPDDVVVVQVGDLVDRGPDSMGVLELVGQVMGNQPGQWVQLLGNHEWQYLPEGTVFWPQPLAPEGVRTLTSWWDSGLLGVAAAVATADGQQALLTHAGLTVGCWRQLDEPLTASSAAWALNDRPPLALRRVHQGVDRGTSPLWADAGWELCEPWLEYAATGLVPFGQIHGHSSIVSYPDRTWRCPGRVRQRAIVDWRSRQTRVRVGGRLFIGVDPKHGSDGAPSWRPLVLDDATVLSPALAL